MSYRWRLEELATRYQLEPDLMDVFVEGPSDASFLSIIQESGLLRNVVAYSIETVEVSNSWPFDNNNRGRLIKMSEYLASQLSDAHGRCACIIDRDFENFIPQLPPIPLLFITDYSCNEGYFISEDTIATLIRRCRNSQDIDVETITKWIIKTATQLFRIRLINSKPRWNLKKLDSGDDLKFSSGRFGFNEQSFLRRYLNKSGRISELHDFRSECDNLPEPLSTDYRHCIQGHDLIELIQFTLNSLNPPSARIASPDALHYFLFVLAKL